MSEDGAGTRKKGGGDEISTKYEKSTLIRRKISVGNQIREKIYVGAKTP